MMRVAVTKFDEELVAHTKKFLDAAEKHPESRALLERFGYTAEEHARGRDLVLFAERSFEWERSGRAYNFLAPTPERRAAEARAWFSETRRRHVQSAFKRAEEAAGWVGNGRASAWPWQRKLTIGALAALPHLANAVSIAAWRAHRAEVMRGRPDLLAPYGLTAGKAPPRLRGKEARLKYGEGAAGTLKGAPAPVDDDEDESDDDAAPPATTNGVKDRGKSLPLVRS
jgi:hypothetical protein